ncbi:tryptophan-rich sensory protein [Patescibacteria group bacterium]|nr:tryptophan-rich sensory protein [Patescibacteria group bacterium]MBU1721953.1 tryptophan-rich sensory protein [Patescibacteria group bacterium]MBU1901774.1 tryptophan-rich sensory protein [Patescibacteria group bacterium]
MKKPCKLISSILIPLLIGFGGSFFTVSSINSWYSTINKPFFNPPNWIFSPVWTTLFILIGISFYLVWQKDFGKNKKQILAIYFTQLAFNFFWSIFFFALQNPLLAFIEIIILWILIFLNIKVFYKIDKRAGYLLIPYLLWVSFASILNLSIVILN